MLGDTAGAATSNKTNLDWRAQAVMSAEGMYRPVSKFGGMNTSSSRSSGFLPQYTMRNQDGVYEGAIACASGGSGSLASSPKGVTPPLLAGIGGGTGNDGYSPYLYIRHI